MLLLFNKKDFSMKELEKTQFFVYLIPKQNTKGYFTSCQRLNYVISCHVPISM